MARRSRLWFGGFVFLAMYFFMPALNAATPQDTLVMANQIDDIITLDPAEVFEFSGAEYAANVYDRLVTYPPDDVENLQGNVAESWTIADDGKTYTFKVRDGITFHSGNQLTAEDAVFSLKRVVKLNQTPAFILTQFGFTPENVDQRIQVVDPQDLHGRARQALRADLFSLLPDRDRGLGGRPEAGDGARAGRRSRP